MALGVLEGKEILPPAGKSKFGPKSLGAPGISGSPQMSLRVVE